jgi:predicted N-acetyltransferase YhbS
MNKLPGKSSDLMVSYQDVNRGRIEHHHMSEIIITNTRPEHGEAVAKIICAAYNVPPGECIPGDQLSSGDDIRGCIKRFPEGQFVALDGEMVVGMACTRRVNRAPSEKPLTWMDQIGDLTIANHDPNGEWLYGVEVTVPPEHRKRGIATQLYEARFDLVRRLNLRGWYAVGMLMGYQNYRDQMSVRDYGEKVIRGEITDPTVTMQMNRGFRATMVVENYLDEPQAGDAGALIIWDNPDYHAEGT